MKKFTSEIHKENYQHPAEKNKNTDQVAKTSLDIKYVANKDTATNELVKTAFIIKRADYQNQQDIKGLIETPLVWSAQFEPGGKQQIIIPELKELQNHTRIPLLDTKKFLNNKNIKVNCFNDYKRGFMIENKSFPLNLTEGQSEADILKQRENEWLAAIQNLTLRSNYNTALIKEKMGEYIKYYARQDIFVMLHDVMRHWIVDTSDILDRQDISPYTKVHCNIFNVILTDEGKIALLLRADTPFITNLDQSKIYYLNESNQLTEDDLINISRIAKDQNDQFKSILTFETKLELAVVKDINNNKFIEPVCKKLQVFCYTNHFIFTNKKINEYNQKIHTPVGELKLYIANKRYVKGSLFDEVFAFTPKEKTEAAQALIDKIEGKNVQFSEKNKKAILQKNSDLNSHFQKLKEYHWIDDNIFNEYPSYTQNPQELDLVLVEVFKDTSTLNLLDTMIKLLIKNGFQHEIEKSKEFLDSEQEFLLTYKDTFVTILTQLYVAIIIDIMSPQNEEYIKENLSDKKLAHDVLLKAQQNLMTHLQKSAMQLESRFTSDAILHLATIYLDPQQISRYLTTQQAANENKQEIIIYIRKILNEYLTLDKLEEKTTIDSNSLAQYPLIALSNKTKSLNNINEHDIYQFLQEIKKLHAKNNKEESVNYTRTSISTFKLT